MSYSLSHCAQTAREHDRDRFMASLFVPLPEREALLALLALNIELAQIHDKVREEMIGHIRYAWWQENIEGLYAGGVRLGHPVLEALAPVVAAGHLPQKVLMPLVESYRTHYPALPPDRDTIVENVVLKLLRSLCPGSEKGWQKAQTIIERHRQRYGQRRNGWLAFKLLLIGAR